MKILGIHDGHNASVCLLIDGKIESFIQEERLTNIKNYIGFPFKSINEVLKTSGLTPDNIDVIAMAGIHMGVPFNASEVTNKYREESTSRGKVIDFLRKTPMYKVYKNTRRRTRLKCIDMAGLQRDKTIFVDHHQCHAAAAYYSSPWKEEPILVLTNDGSGDGLCSTVYVGEGGDLKKIAETGEGNSIGNIYARVTFMLGLVPLEHEWKVMGLAPYASSSSSEKSYQVFKRYLEVSNGSPLTFKRNISEPTKLIYPRLREDLEFHRFDQISGGLQMFTEEFLCEWVRNCVRETSIHKVALGGGVFMNVKANKRIMEMDEIDKLFVVPSCGDETNALGAVYWAYADKCREQGKEVDIQPLRDLYLGTSFTDEDVKQAISELKNQDFEFEYIGDIEKQIAQLLAKGEIVARCKGRMEFGARALGNRSILADAADYSCVRIINMMVKKRDFWMPFAPVIMKEHENDYIVNPKGVSAPYMILSFDTTERRGEFIAAVHQADLTARPQVLEKDWNPELYTILKDFERMTGKGVLLNTSFNLHGYPIVYGPREALWVFENSGLRYLALGNYLLHK